MRERGRRVSEPTAEYLLVIPEMETADQQANGTGVDIPPDSSQATAAQSALWLIYLQRRREAIIMELRALDRALGRPQTIPERTR